MPIGIIVLLNIIVFIRVAVSLISNSKASNKLNENGKSINHNKKHQRTFSGGATSSKETYEMLNKEKCNKLTIAIFSCFVVLGITWLFGFLGINEAKVVFSYLFCLFNASQGFLVLIAYVIMSKPKREMWAEKLIAIQSKFRKQSNYADEDVKDLNYASSLKSNFSNNKYNGNGLARYSKETKSISLESISSNSVQKNPNVISYDPNYLIKTVTLNSNIYKTSDESIQPDTIKKKRTFSFLPPNNNTKSTEPEEYFIKNQKKNLKRYHIDLNTNQATRPKSVNISKLTTPEVLESFTPENLTLRKVLGFEKAIQNSFGNENPFYADTKLFNRVDSNSITESFVAVSKIVNPTGVFVRMQPNTKSKINL